MYRFEGVHEDSYFRKGPKGLRSLRPYDQVFDDEDEVAPQPSPPAAIQPHPPAAPQPDPSASTSSSGGFKVIPSSGDGRCFFRSLVIGMDSRLQNEARDAHGRLLSQV